MDDANKKRQIGGQFGALVRVARLSVSDEEVAQCAADGKAHGASYQLEVTDKMHPEIVLGHMIVVVMYGSESCVDRALKALVEVSDVVHEERKDLNKE